MEAFTAGTLAGAGSFRCEGCGFGVALHELDEVPSCPQCGGRRFKRASMFVVAHDRLPETGEHMQLPAMEVAIPDWFEAAREAQVADGDYIAFEREDRVHVVPLQEGWTRVGRSLSAHIRFDDPTVSRRHALVHRDQTGARVLDDRSLNGVFLNGERVDWHELEEGDQITVGAFNLYFMSIRDQDHLGASPLKLAPGV